MQITVATGFHTGKSAFRFQLVGGFRRFCVSELPVNSSLSLSAGGNGYSSRSKLLCTKLYRKLPRISTRFINYSGYAPSGRDGRKNGVCAGHTHHFSGNILTMAEQLPRFFQAGKSSQYGMFVETCQTVGFSGLHNRIDQTYAGRGPEWWDHTRHR